MNTNKKNGFTLIELIIVMVILGIMAAVAVPRYLDSISNAEEAAEDAVISAIRSGLKHYANNKLYENGRESWPENPFDVLAEKPVGYSPQDCWNGVVDGSQADVDGEWTFYYNGSERVISHQRADNSRHEWVYDAVSFFDHQDAFIGTLGQRISL